MEELPGAAHLLYVRGYYLTERPEIDLGPHWHEVPFDRYTLAWDRRTPLALSRYGRHAIALVGHAYHLGLATLDNSTITQHLVRLLCAGADAYNEGLYDLSGRYVVLAAGPDGVSLQTDAAGTRSAYYAKRGGVVSSHAALTADILRNWDASPFGDQEWFQEANAPNFPGRCTEYDGIFALTPNTELQVETAGIRRVGPTGRMSALSVEEAAAAIVPLLQAQLTAIVRQHRVLISLTAGIDSRVTMAASFPVRKKVTYFSYMAAREDEVPNTYDDVRFAQQLCAEVGVDHQSVMVEKGAGRGGDLGSVMRRNSRRRHAPSLALAYRSQLPQDAMHVRSNVYEIGRSFFRVNARRTQQLPALSPLELGRRCVRNRAHKTHGDAAAAFEDWIEVTGFDAVEGYDPYDLYYWEVRMSRWLPAIMVESDIAHDTFTVVNCRRVLELLLSVRLEDRLASRVFDAIIALTWPALNRYPVNGDVRRGPGWLDEMVQE